MIRVLVIVSCLFTGLLQVAPVHAAPDDVILDEITIRVLDDENMPVGVNDIVLPPASNAPENRPPGPSENASEQAADSAATASDKGKDMAAQKAEKAAEQAARAAEKAADQAARAAEQADKARGKAAEAADKGKGKGRNK